MNRFKLEKEAAMKRLALMAVKEVERRYMRSVRSQN
jgi:hypothetical protein